MSNQNDTNMERSMAGATLRQTTKVAVRVVHPRGSRAMCDNLWLWPDSRFALRTSDGPPRPLLRSGSDRRADQLSSLQSM